MKQVVIENPVLNSPFEEPKRRFKFTDDGFTDEIVDARRVSSYFPLRSRRLAFDQFHVLGRVNVDQTRRPPEICWRVNPADIYRKYAADGLRLPA